jgi:hypothetical protein
MVLGVYATSVADLATFRLLSCQPSAIQQEMFVLTNEVNMRRPGSTAD